jgi:hypothetical protein
MKTLPCLAIVLALILGVTTMLLAQETDKVASSPLHATYKALERIDIDILGGKTNKSYMLKSTDLTNGLNKLSEDGWGLVAIEPGRTHPITGPGGATLSHPPTYIFRKIK